MSKSIKNPVNFTFNIGMQEESGVDDTTLQEGTPFCIAVMGDLSGRFSKTNLDDIQQRVFKQIDSYDYDEILASFKIQLDLDFPETGNVISMPIKKYKDFSPDQLYKNINEFGELRDLRQRLQNNSTFNDAVKEIQGWLVPENDRAGDDQDVNKSHDIVEKDKEVVEASSSIEAISTDNLLDSILEETQQHTSSADASVQVSDYGQDNNESLVEGFVKQMMANRVKISSTPRKEEMLAAVDESISELMRAVLHHPDFQSIESTWQAIRFLVRRIKSGKSIKIFLLDISKEELEQDLLSDDVTNSAAYKLFADASLGDINWNVIVGDYQFGADIDDILLLSQLGYVASKADATFISGMDEKIIGCDSFASTPDVNRWSGELDQNIIEAWSLLRGSNIARNISLAMPSFLIREPYSSIVNPIKSFSFEEMTVPVNHDDYLWANAAYIKVEQLARAFAKQGWNMQLGEVAYTEDLPMYSYQEKGKTVIKPCAEIPLTETGAVIIQEQGIVPLWSVKNKDKIHSSAFYSLFKH